MLSDLKYFVKHSLVYSISSVAAKAMGVVLLPLYSSYLTLSEFGVLGIIEVTLLISVELLNLGQGQALVMLNNSEEYKDKKKSIFFTIFTFSVFIGVIFIVVGEAVVPFIYKYFERADDFYLYLRLSIYIVFLRVINSLFLNKIRADERSVFYSAINLVKLFLTIALAIYFVAFANIGVLGVLYSYVIAEGVNLAIILPSMFKLMSPSFEKKFIALSIKFGVPLIFGTLAMMLLNVSDRYILKLFTDYATVGLYDLGYRVAGVINMFIIMPFGLALMPIAYKIFGTDGDKRFYSKLMTYLTFVLVWAGLALSVFSREIIKLFALNPTYWEAYKVVPVVVLSYVFFGMRWVASLGMFLTRNTKQVAITTTLASILNIALNFWLIPIFGMMAAAYSTLICFVLLNMISKYYSNKYFKIDFENKKILGLILLGIALYLISIFTNDQNIIFRILIKIILVIVFPVILYLVKFYDAIELERIKGFYSKWKHLGNWKNNVIKELKNH